MTDFLDYSDWVKQRPVSSDSTQNKVDYSDYLRKTHLDSNEYSLEVENSIQNELYNSLVSSGDIEQGDIDAFSSLTAPKETSTEAKMDIIQSRTDPSSSNWQTINAYRTAEEDGLPLEEVERLRVNAEFAVDREYDAMKRRMVRSGELAFAAFTNPDGSREVIAGDAAIGANLSDALLASRTGDVSMSDAMAAQQQMQPAFGTTLPAFKASRYNQAAAVVSELIMGDQKMNTLIQAHAELRAGEEDEGFMDTAANVVNAFGDAITGMFSTEKREQNTAMFRAKDVTREQAVSDMMQRINSSESLPSGEEFTAEEIGAAFDHMVLERATAQNMFDQYTGEEAGRNLRISSMGMPIMASDVLANEDLFNSTIKGSNLDDNQKDFLKQTRVSVLTDRFDDYSEIFKRSAVDDEWSQALIEGANEGKKNHEILNDFLKDEDNYNLLTQRAKGIGWSLVNSIGTLAAALPAAAGNKMATDYLADVAQQNSDRRQVARLFGQEYGYRGEIGETLAPMVTDIAATGFLSAGTFGTGGAAYVAVKSGSAAVAKTVTKSYVGHVVKSVPKSVFRIKGAKYQGKLSDAINLAVKQNHPDLTLDVLRTFNSEIVRKAGISSAAAIPAATRSSASTYGAITNALRADTNMSDEEIRDKALGAGLLSGAITGVITGGFSALGRGGLDDALLRGMTFRDMTAVVSKMTNVTQKAALDANVKAALKKSIAESAKKAGMASAALTKKSSIIKSRVGEIAGAVSRNFGDEAVEEGLDQFFNSFVEDAALDQDTPMFERLSQAYHAAVLGGIMGAGAPVVQKVGGMTQRRRGITYSEVDKMVSDVAQNATENLKASGSPVTAAVLERIFKTPMRELVTETPVEVAETPVEAAETPVEAVETPVEAVETPVEAVETPVEAVETPVEAAETPVDSEVVEEAFNDPAKTKITANNVINERSGKNQPVLEEVEDEFYDDDAFDYPQLEEFDQLPIEERIVQDAIQQRERDLREAESELAKAEEAELAAEAEAKIVATDTTTAAKKKEASEKVRAANRAKKVAAKKAAAAKKAVAKKAATKKAVAKKAVAKKAAIKKAVAKKAAAKKAAAKKAATKLKKRKIQKAKDPFYVSPEINSSSDFYNEPAFLSKNVKPEDVTDESGKVVLSTNEREIADQVLGLVNRGYPVSFATQASYAIDLSNHKRTDVSEALARQIYNRFPILEPTDKVKSSLEVFSTKTKKVMHYNPKTGKRSSSVIKGFLTKDGVGVFNNDPVTMLEMLSRNIPVVIPKEYRDSVLLNPSFRGGFDLRSGKLHSIVAPHKDFPSQSVSLVKEIRYTEVAYNFDRARRLASIKFIAPDDKFILPLGVSLTDSRTGKPIEASQKNQHKFEDVLRRTERFVDSVTPPSKKVEAFNRARKTIRDMLYPSKRSSFDRLDIETDFSIPSVVNESYNEYTLLLNFFKIRQDILETNEKQLKGAKIKNLTPEQVGRGVKSLLARVQFDESVGNVTKDKIKALSDMLVDFGLKDFAPYAPEQNVKNFLLNDVVNNQAFVKTGSMPDFMTLIRKSLDRFVDQSIQRDSARVASKSISFEELGEFDVESSSLSGLDAALAADQPELLSVDVDAIPEVFRDNLVNAVNEIDNNSEIRQQVEQLYIASTPNNTQEGIDEVPNLPTEFLIGSIAHRISQAGYDSEPALDALAFRKQIEQGLLPAATNLKNLLETVYYPDANVLGTGKLIGSSKVTKNTFAYADFVARENSRVSGETSEFSLFDFVTSREERAKLTDKGKILVAKRDIAKEYEFIRLAEALPDYAKELIAKSDAAREVRVALLEGRTVPIDGLTKEAIELIRGNKQFDKLNPADKEVIRSLRSKLIDPDTKKSKKKNISTRIEKEIAEGVSKAQRQENELKLYGVTLDKLSPEDRETLIDVTEEIQTTTDPFERSELIDEAAIIIGRANNHASQNSASQAATPVERIAMREDNKLEIERLGLEHNRPESVIAALRIISSESDNPSHKLVADLLLEDEAFISTVDFYIEDSPDDYAGQYVYRNDGTHRVSINIDTGNKLGLENVLLEEYVHAFLSNVTKSNSDQRSDQQNAAVDRLNGIYKLAEKQYRDTGIKDPMLEDAFLDFDEFLAKFLLSPRLQASIKTLEAPAEQRGFFKRIIDSLLSMFRKRKVTKTEAVEYGKALQDVIDLTKSSTLTRTPPLSQEVARVAEDTGRVITKVQEKIIEHQEQRAIFSSQEKDQEIDDTEIPEEPITFESQKSDKIKEIENHLLNRIPRGLSLQRVTDGRFVARLDQGKFDSEGIQTVDFDFEALEVETRGMDVVGAKIYSEKILLHETIHAASYNSLTIDEITKLEESLSEDDYASIAETYFRNDEALAEAKAQLDSEDPEVAALIRRQLAEEHLRMNSERIITGTTTEEDAEFWSSDPSLLSIIARYVRSMFARLAAHRRAKGGSGVLDEMLIRIHDEVMLIQNGYVSYAPSKEFDTDDPEESLREFSKILRRDIGSGQPEGVALDAQASEAAANDVDFSRIPKLLELAVAEYKPYISPEGKFARNFKGDVDLPVRRLMEQEKEFGRSSIHIIKTFHKEFNSIVERDFGQMDDKLYEDIKLSQGFSKENLVREETYKEIEEEHRARLKVIETDHNQTISQLKRDDSLTDEQRDTGIAEARKIRDDKKQESRDLRYAKQESKENEAIKNHQEAVDAALDRVREKSPDLAAKITLMREQLIRPIQKIMTEKGNGLSKQLRARIDRTGGIYLTRQYQIFNDPTYAQKVLEDPDFDKARNAAISYFKNNMKLSDEDANEAMKIFVQQYDTGLQSSAPIGKSYKKIMKNLSRRKDLPVELRELMGEYGLQDSDKGGAATDLILRTFGTVAALGSQQMFRSNLVKWGDRSDSIISKEKKDKDPKFGDYVLLLDPKKAVKGDPLAGMYAAPDTVKDLREVLVASPIGFDSSTAGKTVEGMAKVLQNLTGKSMLFKTLGSVGFYIRNILGNTLFFGPAQGLPLSAIGGTFKDSFVKSYMDFKNPDQIDAELSELIGLGVFGDELRSGMIKELLDGKNESFLDRLNNALDKIPDDKAEGTKEAVSKVGEKIKSLEETLMRLSSNIDGVYKIQYYKHELAILKEAKDKYPDTKIGQLSEDELKRMAADKVKRTAQSLSQAPPIISKLSRSGYGTLFAPFIRFKTEVPRIVFNTYALAKEEINSGNPLIEARGKRRRRAMTAMIGGVSLGLPATLALLFAGIGNDEDEALRKSMPSYLRGHSFFFYRWNGELKSIDLTYVNPFSIMADPVARSFQEITRGDIDGAAGAFLQGSFFDQYLDEQIFAGAVQDAIDNRDAKTDRPISISEVDGFAGSFGKKLLYVMEQAYSPRIASDAVDAWDSMGTDWDKFSDSPAGQFLDGVAPFRIHDVDEEAQFRRFLRDHKDRVNNVRSEKYRLYSDKPISESEIRDVYNDEADGLIKLNKELYTVMQGFKGLGIEDREQFNIMKGAGIGKDKSNLLRVGISDRLTPNIGFLEGLQQRGLADRIGPMLEEKNKRARYHRLDE
jgi:hypothetical protein